MARKKKKQDAKQQRLVNDAAKALLANIRFLSIDKPIKTIVITSSIPDEGKTFVSLNLAQAIASSGARCLLVESDLRKRSLAATMGIHPKSGLYAAIAGTAPFNRVAVATPQHNLYFLDAEPQIPNPPDLFGSQRFAAFVDKVAAHFDYVIFDAPPLGVFIDAAVIASRMDATFLVVRENFTKKEAIRNSYEQLVAAGAEVAGIVMNACNGKAGGYYDYYSYYKEYGKGTKESKAAQPVVEQPQQIQQPQQPLKAQQPQG